MVEPIGTPPDLLRVENLAVHFPVADGQAFLRSAGTVRAVDGVSFSIGERETLGLVGESGCGKSTTGLAVLRMLRMTRGRIIFQGHDISAYTQKEMLPLRRRMQMVFQDPYGSLDPRMRVRDIVGEPLAIHGLSTRPHEERVAELLAMVGLLPGMAERYPHEFSGGQRQRIGIARALALEPSLIVCDEPVSALDVSVQAQVVNLLVELQARLGIAYLFIAHDLAIVRHISRRVAVMYLGKIVEIGDREGLYTDPQHPYTQALLAAIPIPDPVLELRRPRLPVQGEVPSAINVPRGCRFRTRCPHAMTICGEQDPELRTISLNRSVACHLST